MRRQLFVEVWIFFYLAVLQSGVAEAACQTWTNCDTCPGDTCTACNDGFYLYNDKGCYRCHSACVVCTSSGNSSCSVCADGYYLNGTTCCKCYTGCRTCIDLDEKQCTSCKPGYYLTGGTTCLQCQPACTACTDWNVCTACKSGYYHDTESSCIQCQSSCNACTSSTYCTACRNGYDDDSRGTCIKCGSHCSYCSGLYCMICDDGYYNSRGGSCNQCQSPCRTCRRSSSSECTSCTDGYYHDSELSCLQCQSPCKRCTATNSCTACEDSYYLDGAVCNKCATSCTKCSSVSQCTECVTGRYGRECTSACTKCKHDVCDMNGACTQDCKDTVYGTYCNNTCPDNCAACTSAMFCQSCSSNNFNTDKYTKCECDASKCAAISGNLCSACNDMTWYPSHSGCCPCSQTCEGHQCGSGGVCSKGCIDGYYGDLCEHTCDERCLNQVCHRHNDTCIDVADMETQNTGDASQTSSVVGAVVGAAVGALFAVCVITVIVLYKRGCRLKQSSPMKVQV